MMQVTSTSFFFFFCVFFCFQAEDGIRDLVRSRGLGDVYKRQGRSGSAGGVAGGGVGGGAAARNRQHGPLRALEVFGEQHDLSLIHL